jgi:uncharacterized protein (TIGR02246 family)
MSDEDEIRDLIAAYALLLDADDIEACLQLFVDEGEFVVYGKTLVGRERIGRMFHRAPRGMHLTGVSLIDVAADTASARAQVLFVEAGSHLMRPALYDDEFVRIEGKWWFRRRRCQFITTDGLADAPQESAQ